MILINDISVVVAVVVVVVVVVKSKIRNEIISG